MATYEDLLRLQKPSPGRGIGQALIAAGQGMKGQTPNVQEDTSARDMMGKILIAQMEAERAQAELAEKRQYEEARAAIKRQQELQDKEAERAFKREELQSKISSGETAARKEGLLPATPKTTFETRQAVQASALPPDLKIPSVVRNVPGLDVRNITPELIAQQRREASPYEASLKYSAEGVPQVSIKEPGSPALDQNRIYALAEDMARGSGNYVAFQSVPPSIVRQFIPQATKFLQGQELEVDEDLYGDTANINF